MECGFQRSLSGIVVIVLLCAAAAIVMTIAGPDWFFNWRFNRVSEGQTQESVRELIGEPRKTRIGPKYVPPMVTNEDGSITVFVDHGRPYPFEEWTYYSGITEYTVRFGGRTRQSASDWRVVHKRMQEIKDVPNNGVESAFFETMEK